MQINIDAQKVNYLSQELLDISRFVRQSRMGVEDARYRLRQLTQLDGCIAALQKQEESLASLTGELVNMSSALQQIAQVYQDTEGRIQEDLDEEPRRPHESSQVIVYGINDKMHRRIQQILYK